MFRIYCKFRPEVKRASGGDSMGPRQGRGAWVVTHCFTSDLKAPFYIESGRLAVRCPTRRQPGTRCNPRKLLAEYQAARHA